MRQTWKEIQISKCIKTGIKHKSLKPFMFMEIVLIIFFDRIFRGLSQNRKRILGTGLTVLVFLVTNSFSTPSFQSRAVEPLPAEEETMVLLADPKLEEIEAELEELEELEEIDNFQGTDHMNVEEQDQYSVDEILLNGNPSVIMSQLTAVGEEEQVRNTFSKDDWNLILVNKHNPIPENYTFELGTITANMKCDARILPELFAMLQAAKQDGVNLIVCSPYRDISLQRVLFDRKIRLYMGQGHSYMEAYKKASRIVTVPGASEHQVGLALDIICDTYTVLDSGFGETKAGQWLREHSKEYGFILRYPKGKEDITGIGYEPWHFRYVGKEAATIIMDQEITLEEFVESISE